jgi:hypothetical protein
VNASGNKSVQRTRTEIIGIVDLNALQTARVAQPLISWELQMKMGAPLFAFFAKGGHDAAGSADLGSTVISCYRQHLTRPCRERKTGAPTSVGFTKSKPGPPAKFMRGRRRLCSAIENVWGKWLLLEPSVPILLVASMP